MNPPVLVGRSSSHYTRVTRIFALELGVGHDFRPVLDLTTLDREAYAGNPALKIPVWVDEDGPLFGCENICREIAELSGKRERCVLRGDVDERVVANAEELTLHVMSSEVTMIMAKVPGDARALPPKVAHGVEGSLAHLDAHVDALVAALPRDRVLSFVETALYGVLTHLPWREVMDVSRFDRLAVFAADFGARAAAQATTYRFDAR